MSSDHSIYTSEEEIDKGYTDLKTLFATRQSYSLGFRIYNLKKLAYMIEDNRKAIHEAMKEDLGQGSFVVDFANLEPVLNEISLAISRLPEWVKDESRVKDQILLFKTMKPRIRKQPKGVVLIISPWNYPWQLTLIPLVNAIAAGCPAMIKPSELAPRSAELLAELLPKYMTPNFVKVVLGDIPQSTHLLKKEWGHIIYTGSDRVGKIVAKAAADTLTPTTLELGGKSPVIVADCVDLKKTCRRLLSIKQQNTGQMCVSPDYILCSDKVVDQFIAECKVVMNEFFPLSPHPNSLLNAPLSSHIVGQKGFDRLVGMVEQAERDGKLVHKGEIDHYTRRMGFNIVKLALDGVGENGVLVEEEIFGPVIPIIPVSSLDKAIEWVNARPHPLALYVCSSKRSVFDRVINETISGSATWNDFAFATLSRGLPFGGVGNSGWGAYHGYDGFLTFTHQKSCLEIPYSTEITTKIRYPPHTKLSMALLRFFTSAKLPDRPVSVQDEEKRLKWRKWKGSVVLSLVFALVSVAVAMKRR